MSKKKRVMRKFKINEISAVDKPAQDGARMTIMKRADEVIKGMRLTTSVEGHSHLIIETTAQGGETSWAKAEGSEYGHSHPWIRNDDGTITVGEAEGHTHELVDTRFLPVDKTEESSNDAVTKTAESLGTTTKESTMNEEELKALVEKSAKELETLKSQLATAESFGKLSDAEKSFYDSLDEAQKAEFLVKSSEDRAAAVEAVKSSNPVVYKSIDGIEFRKSDDPRLVEMAKRSDAQSKELEIEKAKREDAEFSKRAQTELTHLPGDEATKVAVLKAVDTIKDAATKTKALELLKANNAAMAKAFEKKGTAEGADNSADAKLDALAKQHAETHKVSFAKAYSEVIRTPEGKELYEQINQ